MIKHLGRKQSLAAPETVIDPSTWWLKMMDIQSNQAGYSGPNGVVNDLEQQWLLVLASTD